MSKNAFLSDQRLGVATQPAPGHNQQFGTQQFGNPEFGTQMAPTAAPQPVLPDEGRMTLNGVTTAAGVLFAILMVGAFVGWGLVEAPSGAVQIPGWIMGAVLGGFAMLALAYFKPALAKFIGPAYALIEGIVVGAFSRVYEEAFDGIVMQASLATIGIFGGMWAVYSTGLIKVTDKFRRGVMAATMAIMAMYLISIVSQMLGSSFEIPFLHDSGPIGILISLGIIVIAAFNYLLDFDFIERAIAAGAPKDSEWIAALGLLVTTVWVYFEVLRLLSKLRD